jgi:hypothetical protein
MSTLMEKSNGLLILFHHRPIALVNEQGIFLNIPFSSRGIESWSGLHGRQATQTICVDGLP